VRSHAVWALVEPACTTSQRAVKRHLSKLPPVGRPRKRARAQMTEIEERAMAIRPDLRETFRVAPTPDRAAFILNALGKKPSQIWLAICVAIDEMVRHLPRETASVRQSIIGGASIHGRAEKGL
jgi:hypothetical protein